MLSKAATALSLLFSVLLLLSLPGESSEGGYSEGRPDAKAIRLTATPKSDTTSGFSYGDWLAAGQPSANENWTSGTFVLRTATKDHYTAGLSSVWNNVAANALDIRPLLREDLLLMANNKESQWSATWQSHRQAVLQRLIDTTGDTLLRNALEEAKSHSWVRRLEVDFRTKLRNRPGSFGIDAIVALQETTNTATGLQLRGFFGDEFTGANAGLFYRRATGDNLLGANIFLDYEDNDGAFWRWSLGGEWRNPYVELTGNRYIGITEGKRGIDGTTRYTADGTEIELALRAPYAPWLSGILSYYDWDGEYGDAADTGLRYGIRVDRQLKGLSFEIEYEDPEEGEGAWGGRISYSHDFSQGLESASQPEDLSFDPRAHFFDSVRREYTQRIRQSGNAFTGRIVITHVNGRATLIGSELSLQIAGNGETFTTQLALISLEVISGVTTTVTGAIITATTTAPDDYTITATALVTAFTETPSTLRLSVNDWAIELHSELVFRTDSSTMTLINGELIIIRNNGISEVALTNGVTLNLTNNALISIATGQTTTTLQINSGLISLALNTGNTLDAIVREGTLIVSLAANAGIAANVGNTDGGAIILMSGTVTANITPLAGAIANASVVVTTGYTGLIGQVEATGGSNLRYTVISGGEFTVGATDRLLSLATAQSTPTTLTAMVQVSDSGTLGVQAVPVTASYTLLVGNELLFTPDKLGVTVTTYDNNLLLLTALVGGQLSAVSYALASTNPAGLGNFAIFTDSGIISLQQALTTPTTLSLYLTALENLGNISRTATLLFTVFATDPPAFAAALDNTTPVLITGNAGLVAQVNSSGGSGTHTYAFQSGGNNFAVGDDGRISLLIARPTPTTLIAILTANDGHPNTPQVLLSLTLRILDILNFSPNKLSIQLTTHGAVPVVLHTATATDPLGGVITYALLSTNPAGFTDNINFTPANRVLNLTNQLTSPIAASVYIRATTDAATHKATLLVELGVVDPSAFVATLADAERRFTTGYTGQVAQANSSGGSGTHTYAFDPADGNLTVGTNGSITLLTAIATPTTLTGTLAANDGHPNTPEVKLTLALTILAPVSFSPTATVAMLTTHDSVLLTLDQANTQGGFGTKGYALVSTHPSAFGGNIAVSNNGNIIFNQLITSPITASVYVRGSAAFGGNATLLLTVIAIDPTPFAAVLDDTSPIVITGNTGLVAQVNSSGGGGTHTYAIAPPNGNLTVGTDGRITLLTAVVTPATLLATLTANDGHPNTPAVVLNLTLRVLNILSFSPSKLSIQLTTHGSVPVALHTAVAVDPLGGAITYALLSTFPSNFTANLSFTPANGIVSLTAELTSPQEASVYIRATTATENATLLIELGVVDPPTFAATLADAERRFTTGYTGQVAQVNASGGSGTRTYAFDPADGNLTVGTDGSITLLTAIATPTTLTGTLAANDGHPNTPEVKLTLILTILAPVSFSPTATVAMLTTHDSVLLTLDQANTQGGFGTKGYALVSTHPSAFGGNIAVSNNGNIILNQLITSPITASVYVRGTAAFGGNATLLLTVIAIDPTPFAAVLDNSSPMLITGNIGLAARVNSSGGGGTHTYAIAPPNGNLTVGTDGRITLLTASATPATLTATLTANDGHPNTPAVVLSLTLAIVDALGFTPNKLSIRLTTYGTVPVALHTAVAVDPLSGAITYALLSTFPSNFTANLSFTPANGIVSLTAELTSPQEASVYIRATTATENATLLIELGVVDPPAFAAVFADSSLQAIIGGSGLVAQVNSSGGSGTRTYAFDPADGNLTVGTDGGVVLLTAAATATTLTGTLTANDGHPNTPAVKITLTLAAILKTPAFADAVNKFVITNTGAVASITNASPVADFTVIAGGANFTVGVGVLSLKTAIPAAATLTASVVVPSLPLITLKHVLTVGACSFLTGCQPLVDYDGVVFSSDIINFAWVSNLALAQGLVAAGADVDEMLNFIFSGVHVDRPILEAAENGNLALASLLVSNGAVLTVVGNYQHPALSPRYSNLGVLYYLNDNSSSDVPSMLSLFIANGADVNLISEDIPSHVVVDRTPLDAYNSRSKSNLAVIVKSFGGKCLTECRTGDIALAAVSFSPAAVAATVDTAQTGDIYTVQAASGLGTRFVYEIDSVNPVGISSNFSLVSLDVNRAKLSLSSAQSDSYTIAIAVTDQPSGDKATLQYVRSSDDLLFVPSRVAVSVTTHHSVPIALHTAVAVNLGSGAITYALLSTNPAGFTGNINFTPASGVLNITNVISSAIEASLYIRATTATENATLLIELGVVDPSVFAATLADAERRFTTGYTGQVAQVNSSGGSGTRTYAFDPADGNLTVGTNGSITLLTAIATPTTLTGTLAANDGHPNTPEVKLTLALTILAPVSFSPTATVAMLTTHDSVLLTLDQANTQGGFGTKGYALVSTHPSDFGGNIAVNSAGNIILNQLITSPITASVYVRGTAAFGGTATLLLTVVAEDPPAFAAVLDNSSPMLITGNIGLAARVNSSGGKGTHTYAIAPAGGNLTVGTDGRITLLTASATPATLTATLTANDGHPNTPAVVLSLTLAIVDALGFTPNKLSIRLTTYGTVPVALHTAVAVGPLSGAITYALLSTFPSNFTANLSFTPANGIVSLTAELTSPQEASVYIRATTATENATLLIELGVVDPPTFAATLADAERRFTTGYTGQVAQVNASGGSGTRTYAFDPADGNLTVGTNGSITLLTAIATPTTLTGTLAANDGHPNTPEVKLTLALTILAPVSFSPTATVAMLTTHDSVLLTLDQANTQGGFGTKGYALVSTHPSAFGGNIAVNSAGNIILNQLITSPITASVYVRGTAAFGGTATLLLTVVADDPPAFAANLDNTTPVLITGNIGLAARVNSSGGKGTHTYAIAPAGGNLTVGTDGRITLLTASATPATLTATLTANDGHPNTPAVVLSLTLAIVDALGFTPNKLSIRLTTYGTVPVALHTAVAVDPLSGAITYALLSTFPSNFTANLSFTPANGIVSLTAELTSPQEASVYIRATTTTENATLLIELGVVDPPTFAATLADAERRFTTGYTGQVAQANSSGGSGTHTYAFDPADGNLTVGTDGSITLLTAIATPTTLTGTLAANDGHPNTPEVKLTLALTILAPVSFSPTATVAMLTTHDSVLLTLDQANTQGGFGTKGYALVSTHPSAFGGNIAVSNNGNIILNQLITSPITASVYVRGSAAFGGNATLLLTVIAIDPTPFAAVLDNSSPMLITGNIGLAARVNSSGGKGTHTYAIAPAGGNLTVGTDGRITLLTASATPATLTATLTANDGHPNTPAVVLSLTLAIVDALGFTPSKLSIRLTTHGTVPVALHTAVAVDPLGGAITYALLSTNPAALVDSFSVKTDGVLSLTAELTSPQEASVYIRATTATENATLLIELGVVDPPTFAAVFADSSPRAIIGGSGLVAQVNSSGGSGTRTYAFDPADGNLTVGTDGGVVLLTAAATATTLTGTLTANDGHPNTPAVKITLTLAAILKTPAFADAVNKFVITNTGAIASITNASPVADFTLIAGGDNFTIGVGVLSLKTAIPAAATLTASVVVPSIPPITLKHVLTVGACSFLTGCQPVVAHDGAIYGSFYSGISTPESISVRNSWQAINVTLARALIAAGADVNERINGDEPLLAVARFGTPALASVLLTAGADADAKSDLVFGDSSGTIQVNAGIFHYLNLPGETDANLLASMFIAAGADVNYLDSPSQRTPLGRLAGIGPISTREILIAAGGKCNAFCTIFPDFIQLAAVSFDPATVVATVNTAQTGDIYTVQAASGLGTRFVYEIDSVNPVGVSSNFSLVSLDVNRAKLSLSSAQSDSYTIAIAVTDQPSGDKATLQYVRSSDDLLFVPSRVAVSVTTHHSVPIALHTAVAVNLGSGAITYALLSTNPAGFTGNINFTPASGVLNITNVISSAIEASLYIRATTASEKTTLILEVDAVAPPAFAAVLDNSSPLILTGYTGLVAQVNSSGGGGTHTYAIAPANGNLTVGTDGRITLQTLIATPTTLSATLTANDGHPNTPAVVLSLTLAVIPPSFGNAYDRVVTAYTGAVATIIAGDGDLTLVFGGDNFTVGTNGVLSLTTTLTAASTLTASVLVSDSSSTPIITLGYTLNVGPCSFFDGCQPSVNYDGVVFDSGIINFAWVSNLALAQGLVAAGADVDEMFNFIFNGVYVDRPILEAAENGNLALASLLVSNGAVLTVVGNYQHPALGSSYSNLGVLYYLNDNSSSDVPSMLSLFITNGADVNLISEDIPSNVVVDRTPLDVYNSSSKSNLAVIVKSFGGKCLTECRTGDIALTAVSFNPAALTATAVAAVGKNIYTVQAASGLGTRFSYSLVSTFPANVETRFSVVSLDVNRAALSISSDIGIATISIYLEVADNTDPVTKATLRYVQIARPAFADATAVVAGAVLASYTGAVASIVSAPSGKLTLVAGDDNFDLGTNGVLSLTMAFAVSTTLTASVVVDETPTVPLTTLGYTLAVRPCSFYYGCQPFVDYDGGNSGLNSYHYYGGGTISALGLSWLADVGLLQSLIVAGADTDEVFTVTSFPSSRTPVIAFIAANISPLTVAEALLDAGAEVNVTGYQQGNLSGENNNWGVFHYMTRQSSSQPLSLIAASSVLISLFATRGADINQIARVVPSNQYTPVDAFDDNYDPILKLFGGKCLNDCRTGDITLTAVSFAPGTVTVTVGDTDTGDIYTVQAASGLGTQFSYAVDSVSPAGSAANFNLVSVDVNSAKLNVGTALGSSRPSALTVFIEVTDNNSTSDKATLRVNIAE